MFIYRLTGFDFDPPPQHGAVFDHQAFRLQVSGNIPCAPELDLLAPNNLSVNAPAHNYFARNNISLHFAVRANSQAAVVAQIYLAFDVAIHKKIFAAGNFTLDANALTDARGSFKGNRWVSADLAHRVAACSGQAGCISGGRFWYSLRLYVFFLPHETPRRRIFTPVSRSSSGRLGVATWNGEDSTALRACKGKYLVANLGCAVTCYTTSSAFRAPGSTISCDLSASLLAGGAGFSESVCCSHTATTMPAISRARSFTDIRFSHQRSGSKSPSLAPLTRIFMSLGK